MKRGDKICIQARIMDIPEKGVIEARTKHGTKIFVHPKDAEALDKVTVDLDPDVQKWATDNKDAVKSGITKEYLDAVKTKAELGLEETNRKIEEVKNGKQSEING